MSRKISPPGAHVLGFVPGSGMDFLKPENSIEILDNKRAEQVVKTYDSSQVNPMVRAYLVPDVTFSTWCLFSGPDVNADTRPDRGCIVLWIIQSV